MRFFTIVYCQNGLHIQSSIAATLVPTYRFEIEGEPLLMYDKLWVLNNFERGQFNEFLGHASLGDYFLVGQDMVVICTTIRPPQGA